MATVAANTHRVVPGRASIAGHNPCSRSREHMTTTPIPGRHHRTFHRCACSTTRSRRRTGGSDAALPAELLALERGT